MEMSRLWILSVLGVNVACWYVAAQESTLTVTSPTSGDIYSPGGDAVVEWNSTGNGTIFVISLLNDGQYVDESLCEDEGCSAPDGFYKVTLPSSLEPGTKYSFLVGDRGSTPKVYGESETFEILALNESSGGDSDSTLWWKIIVGAAAVLAIILAGCFIARSVRRENEEKESSMARPQRSAAEGDVSVEGGDVFCGTGTANNDAGVSSMAGIVEMGGLSPVQEESAAVVTTNPMRAAIAIGGSFHSTGGESDKMRAAVAQGSPFHSLDGESESMRRAIAQGSQFQSVSGDSAKREDEEDEETEGMFADAAVVAALAAAAAARAQKPEQTPVRKSGNNTPRWGWQGSSGGWVKSTAAVPPQVTPNSVDVAAKEEERKAKAPAWSAGADPPGPAMAATIASTSSPSRKQPKPPAAMAPQEPDKELASPLALAPLPTSIIPDARAAVAVGITAAAAVSSTTVTASQQTPVAEVEGRCSPTVAPDGGERSAQELEPVLSLTATPAAAPSCRKNLLGLTDEAASVGSPATNYQSCANVASAERIKSEPELEIPNPGAHGSESGPEKAEKESSPTVDVKVVLDKEPVTIAAGGGAASAPAAPQVSVIPEGQAKVLHETRGTDCAEDVADRFSIASVAVQKSSTIPTDIAELPTASSPPTIASGESSQLVGASEPHERLRLPPKSTSSQPGTPRRAGVTTPAQQCNLSTNTSDATPDRLFATCERSLTPKKASWIGPLATTPHRTPRAEGEPERSSSSSGRGANWAIPLATPDRTPKDARSAPEDLSAQSTPVHGTTRLWATPLATPDRTLQAAAPDSGSGAATPERTAIKDIDDAPRSAPNGVTPTYEVPFAWQLESPAGVDGMPSPDEQLPGVAFKPGGRGFPSIFAAVGSADSPANGTVSLTPPMPRGEKTPRHRLNSSEDTTSSFAGWEAEARVADGLGFGALQVAAFVAEAAADAEAESVREGRPTSLERANAWGGNAAPSPSGPGGAGDEVEQEGFDGTKAGAAQDPFDEAAEVAALVAEAMALADKDGNHVEALYRVTGEENLEQNKDKRAKGSSSSVVEAGTQSKSPTDGVAEGRWGSERRILNWTEGEVVHESDAEREAEEVQALVAEALALVKAAAEDGNGGNPTEE